MTKASGLGLDWSDALPLRCTHRPLDYKDGLASGAQLVVGHGDDLVVGHSFGLGLLRDLKRGVQLAYLAPAVGGRGAAAGLAAGLGTGTKTS